MCFRPPASESDGDRSYPKHDCVGDRGPARAELGFSPAEGAGAGEGEGGVASAAHGVGTPRSGAGSWRYRGRAGLQAGAASAPGIGQGEARCPGPCLPRDQGGHQLPPWTSAFQGDTPRPLRRRQFWVAALHPKQQGKGLALQTFWKNCPGGLGASAHPRFGRYTEQVLLAALRPLRGNWLGGGGWQGGRWWRGTGRDECVCTDSLQS